MLAVSRQLAALVAATLLALAVGLGPVGPAGAQPPSGPDPGDPSRLGERPGLGTGPVTYGVPVPGSVVRGFEPPGSDFGAGHRGVDLDASPGEVVRTAGTGQVTFAGSVAGTRWVSVQHADGVLTSYGPLAPLRIRTGEQVAGGQPLGVLAAGGHGHGGQDRGLHWGARRYGRYLDPLTLLDAAPPRPSLVGAGRWEGTDHAVTPYDPWPGGRADGWLVHGSPTADRPGFAVPPNPNHLILLEGLSSSSQGSVLDPEHLGYDPGSVTAFSYAGREEVPDGTLDASDPRRDQRPYGPSDTWEGSGPAAERLAEQLRAQAAREPGRPVDLIGHSMGGVVIWRYLLEHHDPYDLTLPPIGHVVTMGSPLRGSDLAAAGGPLLESGLLGPVAELLQDGFGVGAEQLPLGAPAIEELAVGSDELEELARAWDRALDDGTAGPLATGTRILTIGGSLDPVVVTDRSRMPQPGDPGMDPPPFAPEEPSGDAIADGVLDVVVEHRVLPGGHLGVTETQAANEVTWRFLAGEEVVASPGHASTFGGLQLGRLGRISAELLSLWGPPRHPAAR